MKKTSKAFLCIVLCCLFSFFGTGCFSKIEPWFNETIEKVQDFFEKIGEDLGIIKTSDDDSSEEHEHDYAYNTIVTPPTCKERGHTMFICVCGDFYISNYTDKIDHTYKTSVVAPTCTEKGYTLYTCVCGDNYKGDYTDTIEHTYNSSVIAPTCTEQGYTLYTCVCGDNYIADYTDTIEHTYDLFITEPTCMEQGYTLYKCVCGDNYTDDYTAIIDHITDDSGYCTMCDKPIYPTMGVFYAVSESGTYAEVIGHSGSENRIIIAEKFKGVPVQCINDEVFKSASIVSVLIPDSVTTIGYSSFAYCENLTTVEFGKGITSIGASAFYHCSNLKEALLPNSITNIGVYAFSTCANLEKVILGNEIKEISSSIFNDCPKLIYNEYEGGKYLGTTENEYYLLAGLSNKDQSTYSIHSKCKVIGMNAFFECQYLTEMVIPEGIIVINSYSFENCDRLKKVIISKGVEIIGVHAFNDCDKLTVYCVDTEKPVGWQSGWCSWPANIVWGYIEQ